MRHRENYEQELVTTVGSGTERWLTELRLAVVGIILSVALAPPASRSRPKRRTSRRIPGARSAACATTTAT